MKELFLPYKLAVIAKEKGFNEPCIGLYFKSDNNDRRILLPESNILWTKKDENMASVLAPLYQQIADWLRDTHEIRFKIEPTTKGSVEIFVFEKFTWTYISTYRDDQSAYNDAFEYAFNLI